MFSVVVAAAYPSLGIGAAGALPWRIAADMAFFRTLTTNANHSPPSTNAAATNAVVMGRKTWDSIPARFRPLPGRFNIVVTRTPSSVVFDRASSKTHNDNHEATDASSPTQHVAAVSSFDAALELASELQEQKKVTNIFVIGGAEIYAQALSHPRCSLLFLTWVYSNSLSCDTFLPLRLFCSSPNDPDTAISSTSSTSASDISRIGQSVYLETSLSHTENSSASKRRFIRVLHPDPSWAVPEGLQHDDKHSFEFTVYRAES